MPTAFGSGLFVALGITLYVALLVGAAQLARVRPAYGLGAGVVISAWLSITGRLADQGALGGAPGSLLLVGAIGLVTATTLALAPPFGAVLDRVHGGWLVGLQVFRLPLELALWRLAAEGLFPRVAALHGLGADVVTGALAPVVAWLVFVDGSLSRRAALAFHGFGIAALALLAVEIARAREPAAFTSSAAVWLPAFLVPAAWFMHLASLRQLAREGRLARDARSSARDERQA